MIQLTRLNGNPLVVNSDLIKYAEASPDTVLTLVNGEKIVVLESCAEVVRRTAEYRAQVFGTAAAVWLPSVEAARPAAKEAADESGRNARKPGTGQR
ncbi:MAG: flagellar FlbD family protein [Acidobacteriaceae bacterium]